MSGDEGKRPEHLRAMFGGKGAAGESPIQRKQDAQLTRWNTGTGTGIDEIKAKLAADPTNEGLRDWLAFSYYTNEQIDDAIAIYQGLVKDHPENPSYHYYLGNAYVKKGNYKGAVERWKRVLELRATPKMQRKAEARITEAEAILRRKTGP